MALIIGLTGGIGAGKSTAATFFREQGIPVVDADAISRAITGPGARGSLAVAELFGEDFLTPEHARSEERRVGKECRIGCRSRWSPYH